jgi:hypothetical protein
MLVMDPEGVPATPGLPPLFRDLRTRGGIADDVLELDETAGAAEEEAGTAETDLSLEDEGDDDRFDVLD